MAKLDGTNGLIQQYDYQVLTTGFSYTFASGTQTLVANPAGTLATGTITMPAAPADGMVIWITTTQQIVALTMNGNTGQTLTSKVTSLAPNQAVAYIYRVSNTTWYPFETQMAQGNGPAFSYYLGAGQTISTATDTKIQFATKIFDTNNYYDATTNYRFTPLIAGYYQITVCVRDGTGATAGSIRANIYKNGGVVSTFISANNTNSVSAMTSDLIFMNGSTDYIEGYIYQNSGANMSLQTNAQYNYITGVLVRTA